jgi:hypothetical protein
MLKFTFIFVQLDAAILDGTPTSNYTYVLDKKTSTIIKWSKWSNVDVNTVGESLQKLQLQNGG